MTLYLVTGGSASGKSAFAGRLAEQLVEEMSFSESSAAFCEADGEVSLSSENRSLENRGSERRSSANLGSENRGLENRRSENGILYIATLADRGEESMKKVQRHRELRKSGNYAVVECFSIEALRNCCRVNSEKVELQEQRSEASTSENPSCGVASEKLEMQEQRSEASTSENPSCRVDSEKVELQESGNGLLRDDVQSRDRKVCQQYPVVLFDSLDGFTADLMFYQEKPAGSLPESIDPETAARQTVQAILALNEVCDSLIVVSDHVYSDGMLYDEFTQRYMEYTSLSEQMLAGDAKYVIEVVCGIPVLLKGEKDEFSAIADYHVVSLYENSNAVS